MLGLKAAGALERCETLPHEIDPEAVLALNLSEYSESNFARENLRALKRLGSEPELVRALKEALDRGEQIIAHSGYTEARVYRFRKESERLKEKNEHLEKKNERLKEKNERLEKKNEQLIARFSSRRSRALNAVTQIVLKIPGAARLLQKT